MRRLGLILATGLLVLVAALWLVPRHLDWEGHRGRLAALAASELGRPVALQGAVRVTLLPQPMVEADAVIVGGGGPDDLRLAARGLRLRLDLASLLRMRLAPREVALVGAEIRLPWPPQTTPALRPPPWLTTFEARIEDSRVLIGDAVLEGVSARFTAGGVLEAVRAEGGFAWRGTPVSFRAVVGRPGYDGSATLDLTLAALGASATARGVLIEEGGFDGSIEATAPDLAAFAGTPPGAFRANGRLAVGSDLLVARDLAMEFAGVPARGAAALRLADGPRLEIAVEALRLDLDAWLAAIRAAPVAPIPVTLDLAADAATFRGVALRRLRGGILREGERVALSEVAMLLPGEMEVQFDGATAGGRLELALRFNGANLRETLAALAVPLDGTDPARFRRAEGRARMALSASEIAVSELAATLDEARISGAGVLRHGARPSLGLGLELDRLDLDALLPVLAPLADPAALGIDANLRIAAEQAVLGGMTLERAALDAAFEGGRLLVRRLGLRVAGADVALSGALAFGAATRLSDASVEVTAADATGLLALVPPGWAPAAAFGAQPLALRVSGGGTAEALGLRAEGELGDLRVEAEGTLDALNRRGGGTLTLRHPGTPRLLSLATGQEAPEWLGAGSFSLIATLAAATDGVAAENFALVAGELRAAGRAAIAWGGPRPRLTGRIQAETLPLPDLFERPDAPLGLERLAEFDAEVTLEAGRVTVGGLTAATDLRAGLVLGDASLRIAVPEARVSGGRVEGEARIEGGLTPPRVALGLRFAEVTLAAPLAATPVDLSAGVIEGSIEAQGAGHGLAGLVATLSGEARVALRDGVLQGLSLAALPTAGELPDPAEAEAALRAATERGATAIERLDAVVRLSDGRAALDGTRLAAQGGTIARIGGAIDLARGVLDLAIAVAMPSGAPEVGLRLTGPASGPHRLPELAPWLRWRAEQ